MADHITEWLGAYLDGELRGTRLRQVESHLAACEQCQIELDGMQGLSALLHETAPTGDFLPAERFVSNLTLNLPRQTEQSQTRKSLEIGWWLIPVGLLGTWVFVQATFQLSSLVMAASDFGLFGANFTWFDGGIQQTRWFALLMNIFDGQPGFLFTLNNTDLFLQNLTGQFIWQAALAVLYLGWLASWWIRYQRQAANMGIFSQS